MVLARIELMPSASENYKFWPFSQSKKEKLCNGCRPPLSLVGSAGIREINLIGHDFLNNSKVGGNRASRLQTLGYGYCHLGTEPQG